MSFEITKLSDEERQANKELCCHSDCKAKHPLYEVSEWIGGGVGSSTYFICEKCYKQWKKFQSSQRGSAPSDGYSRKFGYQGSGGLKGSGRGQSISA